VPEYVDVNRANWDERAPAHAASPDYAVDRFDDPAFLSDVVRFDQPRLGDVAGLEGVHLQCHIGTDTVSLARLGAHMTGLDFSAPAIEEARRIAARAGADIAFVQSELYDAPQVLKRESFDLVYTGIGALCWLPSVDRWADVVSELLRPGGRVFVREGHPVLWATADEMPEGRLVLDHPYFEVLDGTRFVAAGTYVATDVAFAHNTTIEWNHGLGEIVTALFDHGLDLTMLVEHDSVPWDALPGHMAEIGGGEYRLIDRPERLPHSYTLSAVKRA
jgi:2-polyprenyl-3-methyl-5-hydroxy-6-metoxy-1,4-benzoquinol methylase